MNTATTTETVRQMSPRDLARYARHSTDPEVLATLSRSGHAKVRSAVASNPFAQIETLEELTQDRDLAIRSAAWMSLTPNAVLVWRAMAKLNFISSKEASKQVARIYKEEVDGGLGAERLERQKQWLEDAAGRKVEVMRLRDAQYEYQESITANRVRKAASTEKRKGGRKNKAREAERTYEAPTFTTNRPAPIIEKPAAPVKPLAPKVSGTTINPRTDKPVYWDGEDARGCDLIKRWAYWSRRNPYSRDYARLMGPVKVARNTRIRTWGRAQGWTLKDNGPIPKQLKADYGDRFALDRDEPHAVDIVDAHVLVCEECKADGLTPRWEEDPVRAVPMPTDANHDDYCPLIDNLGCPCKK